MTNTYFVQAEGNSRWEVLGDLLASSSSRTQFKPRWVEFELYKTIKGTYVIHRVGKSLFFHQKSCKVVGRNNLKPLDIENGMVLEPGSIPCPDCNPTIDSEGGVFPETPRYFALKTTTAKGVLAAVMQRDDNNSEYLTNVAKRLLLDAAKLDDDIYNVFSKRVID